MYRDAVVNAIGSRPRIILAGHSFGGIQISNVAEAVSLFCADCPAAVKAGLHLLDEPLGPMAQPVKLTAEHFGTVKRYYVTTLQDVVVSTAKQKEMYTATPVEKVYPIATGHAPFLAKPAELARILLSIP